MQNISPENMCLFSQIHISIFIFIFPKLAILSKHKNVKQTTFGVDVNIYKSKREIVMVKFLFFG